MTDLANRGRLYTVTGTPGTDPVTWARPSPLPDRRVDGFGANAAVTVVLEDGAAWGVKPAVLTTSPPTLARG